jgi:hypothetical protein
VQPFLHKEAQQLTELLQALVAAFRLYDGRDPGVHAALLALLDRTAAACRDRGRADGESRMASLKAELTTALRGINPVTLEKLSTRRHEMQSGVAFKVLQAVEGQVRGDLEAVADRLRGAEDLITQIVIAALQKGLLTADAIAGATTSAALEALWQTLGADPEIALGQKRVLLLVSSYDALLLIDAVLSRLR